MSARTKVPRKARGTTRLVGVLSHMWLLGYPSCVLGSELGFSGKILHTLNHGVSSFLHIYKFISSGFEMKYYSISQEAYILWKFYIFRRKSILVLMITKPTSSYKSSQQMFWLSSRRKLTPAIAVLILTSKCLNLSVDEKEKNKQINKKKKQNKTRNHLLPYNQSSFHLNFHNLKLV